MNLEILQNISKNIKIINNFPKNGIVFRNINSLMNSNYLFTKSIEYMSMIIKDCGIKIDYIVGVESRGFLFTGLAKELDCGFVMVRKPGKLPTTKVFTYTKEYGSDSLTIEDDIIQPGSNVLIVDDLIATGGTLWAASELVKMIGSTPVGVIGLIQLDGLELNKGLLNLNIPILSLLKYQVDSLSNVLDMNLNYHLIKFLLNENLTNDTNTNIFVKKFYPIKITDKLNFNETIVFYHPNVESLAINYVNNNSNCRLGTIIWNKFPDSQPNIKFESNLENKRIVFFMTVFDNSLLFEQLSIIKILPRQFIKSLDIYICYYSVGTMERVDVEGTLATADTMANIISNCIEICKEGKPTIHIYDIHTLQNRFYFDYNKVQIKLHSGVELLKNKINQNSIIVFPDDGSYKRFGKDFLSYKTLICSKVRDGESRKITIRDKINFPLDESNTIYAEIIIIDDLVQSGSTLIECKKALEAQGYFNISAYVTHSIFPNDSWKKIISAGFKHFYTTNSVPEVINKINTFQINENKQNPFIILNLFGDNIHEKTTIFVSSHNEQKLQACWNSFVEKNQNHFIDVYGVNVQSNIPEQPFGENETNLGSLNRLNNLIQYLTLNNFCWNYCFSYENGIVQFNDNDININIDIDNDVNIDNNVDNDIDNNNMIYNDVCFLNMAINYKNNNVIKFSSNSNNKLDFIVQIPNELINKIKESNQNITIGKIIQNTYGIPKDLFHEIFNKKKLSRIDIMETLYHTIFQN